MPTDKNIKTPEALYKFFEQYKKCCKDNPKYENIYSNSQKKVIQVPREIPLTWDGFEIWLRKENILVYLDDYKSNKDDRYSEYAYIIHACGREIYEDKFTGAATELFNPNIIARDLGLRDHRNTEHDFAEGIKKIAFEYVPPVSKTKKDDKDN